MADSEQCLVTVDFDSDQLDLIKLAARICEQSVSDFVMDAAFDKAVKTVISDKVSFLSDEAYQAVCQTLLQSHR
jgi:uncharacterized protein (DUF1778 family)